MKGMAGAENIVEIDQSTLERARENDQAAFAAIVRRHQAMVYSIANNMLRDRDSAEELAQEVFLQLYRNLDKLESPAHLTFWLRRTTSHRCIDFFRRSHGRKQISLDEAPELSVEANPGDPLLSSLLRRLVASLPDKTRLLITLRFQEDLPPSEIAEIVGMPVNTVKSQLQRTLVLLGEKLSNLEKVAV
jgi:RNA polymerase sigma-70 factor (ECF subfamily)